MLDTEETNTSYIIQKIEKKDGQLTVTVYRRSTQNREGHLAQLDFLPSFPGWGDSVYQGMFGVGWNRTNNLGAYLSSA